MQSKQVSTDTQILIERNSIDKKETESPFLTATVADSNDVTIMESTIRDNKRRYAVAAGAVLVTILLVSFGLGFGLSSNTSTATTAPDGEISSHSAAFAAHFVNENPCANVLDNTVVCLSLDTFTQCYGGATNPTQPVASGTECCLGEMVFAGTCTGSVPASSATSTSSKSSNSASSIRRRKTSTDSSAVSTDTAQAPATSTAEVPQPATTAFEFVKAEALLTTADVPIPAPAAIPTTAAVADIPVPVPAPVPTTAAIADIPVPVPAPVPTTAAVAVVVITAAARATTAAAVPNNGSGSSSSAKVLISGSGDGSYYYDSAGTGCANQPSLGNDLRTGAIGYTSCEPSTGYQTLLSRGDNYMVALALDEMNANKAGLCGKQVIVKHNGVVQPGNFVVWDSCPACTGGVRLDFSLGALQAIAPDVCTTGIVSGITWEVTDVQVIPYVR
ncbi:hypothetical protein HDU98_009021 [Podochytrium sp. JEL0797]|nr:hypothetical protein HDU98_009021 [Podochytrium sp. JEL0797]